jgi:Tol biopolymer transport system component/tRNA A-37 threonylcarbamoyl transferase component Bud32
VTQTDHVSAALLGRYRIERELGQGGMATVYLAYDTKHDRKVAIKVLKPELAAVLGAERFIVEIKTTAALQHPHILPLFDSGEADGFLYYVMPYVEGETIREKLNRETQLAVDDAVRIAREVADALDYAHRHGVIHRDIKPENILLHDGRAMVMDFGIALALSAAAGGRMTETGLSLGTPHYMSPEQATAEKDISARSDIYSLASVLYEMLAGEPPHTAGSAQAVIMKIITETAAPVTSLRKSVPANVASALGQALQKVPADRFASAKAFSDALANATYASPGDERVRAALVGSRGWRDKLVVPLAVVATAAIVAALWGWMRQPEVRPVVRYRLSFPDSALFGGTFARVATTPDGSRILYRAAARQSDDVVSTLWVRDLDKLAPTKLAGTEGAKSPFVSPDGGSAGYFQNRSLWTVSLHGGTPAIVCTGGVGEYGGSWSSDGFIYMSGEGPAPLVKVRAVAGSKPEPFTRLDTLHGETYHVWPEVLPNGNGVLFVVRNGPAENWEIAVADTRTGHHRVLTKGIYARYAKSGHLLIVTASGALTAARFDARALRLLGDPVSLDESIGVHGTSRVPDLAITNDGTLLYSTQSQRIGGSRGEPVWVGRDGIATPIQPGWTTAAEFPSLSPDGSQLAISIQEPNEGLSVWVRQLARGTTTKLSHEGTLNFRASWTADGRSVVYLSNRGKFMNAFAHRPDGTEKDSLLLARSADVSEALVTRDGRWIVYRQGANSLSDLYARRLSGDTTPVPLATTEYLERNPEVSPEGRYLAYTSDETGRMEVYLHPFPNVRGGKWVVSSAGGQMPLWSRDGKELFYRNAAGDMVSVEVTASGTPPLGRQRVLFSALPYTVETVHRTYDVTPDGRRFVMLRAVAGATVDNVPLIVVENFFEVLRKKVPR